MGHSPPSETAKTTVTISIANPCVVTLASHGFNPNQPVVLATSGALPTGLTAGTPYYALPVDSGTMNLAAIPSGAPIVTSGSQSGTQTISQPPGTMRVVRLHGHVTEGYFVAATPFTGTADAATAAAAMTTALAALDLIASTATTGFIALFGSGSGGTLAYAAHQITGAPDTTPAATTAHVASLVTLINTALTAVLAAQTAVLATQSDLTGQAAAIAAVKAAARAQSPSAWKQRRVHQAVNEDSFEFDVISSDDGL